MCFGPLDFRRRSGSSDLRRGTGLRGETLRLLSGRIQFNVFGRSHDGAARIGDGLPRRRNRPLLCGQRPPFEKRGTDQVVLCRFGSTSHMRHRSLHFGLHAGPLHFQKAPLRLQPVSRGNRFDRRAGKIVAHGVRLGACEVVRLQADIDCNHTSEPGHPDVRLQQRPDLVEDPYGKGTDGIACSCWIIAVLAALPPRTGSRRSTMRTLRPLPARPAPSRRRKYRRRQSRRHSCLRTPCPSSQHVFWVPQATGAACGAASVCASFAWWLPMLGSAGLRTWRARPRMPRTTFLRHGSV